MKITNYQCFTVGTGWRNLTYLMIETDEGISGFGEAHIVGKTHTVREYLKDIKRHIIGHDVFNIEDLYNKVTLIDFGAPGQVAMTGFSLVEMACWDCIGKKVDQIRTEFGDMIKRQTIGQLAGADAKKRL